MDDANACSEAILHECVNQFVVIISSSSNFFTTIQKEKKNRSVDFDTQKIYHSLFHSVCFFFFFFRLCVKTTQN